MSTRIQPPVDAEPGLGRRVQQEEAAYGPGVLRVPPRVAFVGSARYAFPLSETDRKKFALLRGLGHLFVIGFSEGAAPLSFTDQARFVLLPNLPSAVLRYALMFILGPVLIAWMILRDRVQVLIAQGPYEAAAAACGKVVAGWLGRSSVLVVESHGDFEESLFLQRRLWPESLYHTLMTVAARFAFRHADLLRAISSTTRAQLLRWAGEKPVWQFPAWTDIDTFLAGGPHGLTPRPPVVLYAGVLVPQKGVHHLIRAFAHLCVSRPDARLIVAGRAENGAYVRHLQGLIRELNLRERVHLAGRVPQWALATLMRETAVVVLPSLSEGLGRVLLEAMATRTPVIASRTGGPAEIVDDGVTGFLVPPGDEQALADALRWILEHPAEAAAMGDRGHLSVSRWFSTEAYVQGFRQILAAAMVLLRQRSPHALAGL